MGSDPLGGSGHAGFIGSQPQYDSTRGIPPRDRHPEGVDQQFGLPLQIVTESGSSTGFFQNASHFTVENSTLIDKSSQNMHIVNNLQQGKTVLEILYQEMTKGADIDSFARWPPPKCYPGTRTRLTAEIQTWLLRGVRKWDFLWLSGPAGVGKSAVAQTVAEFALGEGILGAVYFFSRPNGRYKYIEVFITLAYQLAIRFPGYQAIITAELAAEPGLLEKAPHIQFRRLIIEPLLLLSHERKRVIVLDGLDECGGEGAQVEIIELINNIVNSNTSFPIIWVVCSRPEPHLKRIFARPDHIVRCWREFLHIESEESRRDTETFIRGRFKEIHDQYRECVEEDSNGCWPPETATKKIIEKSSGLFVLADVLLKYIADSEICDPDLRLGEVLAFLEYSRLTGSQRPMHGLDLFYTRILSDIPSDHWATVRQILISSTFHSNEYSSLAVQPICNLLHITRARFYVVMQRLHSVIDIPNPSNAADTPLTFFHASFLDYLTDPSRAGKFFIGRLVSGHGITVATGLRDFMLPALRCLGSTVGLAAIDIDRGDMKDDREISKLLREAFSWPPADNYAAWSSALNTAGPIFSSLFGLLCILFEQCELDDELLLVLHHFDFNAFTFIHYDYQWDFPLQHLHKLVNLIPYWLCI
ncbi:hypothetical protein P691DRAFT_739263 [Macrolepiota fuliginosa MF-IS2]|uniref:Nephrocystin 3-like N-terminal domain-containing protein n=1 Tax=Macrolepiota fuliginosa MF-IS2 TaxID=1400762 RepID=A0A9P5X281_9AGAR|nr:hypothetical protein P691DRAFT_739263 [Macrolepiota fuliginosa MF-IS2]